tara:strand:- start:129 stop:488 length:360 start_codon:yes stop_codon:yes gene_type:complete
VNKLGILKKILAWVSVVVSSAVLLSLVNLIAPERVEIELPAPPVKLTIGCFIDGDPIFMGEVLGPLKINQSGHIEFFSLEWNSKVTLINASCMAIESRLNHPAVKKEGEPLPQPDKQII